MAKEKPKEKTKPVFVEKPSDRQILNPNAGAALKASGLG